MLSPLVREVQTPRGAHAVDRSWEDGNELRVADRLMPARCRARNVGLTSSPTRSLRGRSVSSRDWCPPGTTLTSIRGATPA